MKTSIIVLLTVLAASNVVLAKKKGNGKQSSNAAVGSVICPSCDRLFCTVRKASKLKCKGGVTTDICGCCPVCAKLHGEPCGGEWNYLGKCDEGLYCKPTNSHSNPFSYQSIKTEVPMNGLPEGTCVEIVDRALSDGSSATNKRPVTKGYQSDSKCQPKCTPDFCMKNPKAICSAIDVVDMKRDCHGQCQHTSCYACSWVNPEPDCGSCAPDDFRCIKRFAKCIKRSQCTRQKFPCRTNIPETAQIGKFQCMVPKCLGRS